MSRVALTWAENVGWRESDPFYKSLAIAILVETYGVAETAAKIRQTPIYVTTMIEVYGIASQPRTEISPSETARAVRRLLNVYTLDEIARRVGRSVQELEKVLRENP